MFPINTDVLFRPLAQEDLPLLHEWVQRSHVAEWWQEPTTLSGFERDYLPAIRHESSTRAYIAFCNDRPIGFVQSYVALEAGEGWWEEETDPGTHGIDQFLANAEDLGQGLGSAMVRAFVELLFENPVVTKVQTDPSPKNERAIRSYRRAGFIANGEVDTPDGPALLMVRYRTSHATAKAVRSSQLTGTPHCGCD